MLITSLLPLLHCYSLGFDLVAGPDDGVTLTIIPRKREGTAHGLEAEEARPLSITAAAADIDAELARGSDGALGQLIAARRTLAEQIADQREAADAARAASAQAAKTKMSAAPRPAAIGASAKAAAEGTPPVDADPGAPASLW